MKMIAVTIRTLLPGLLALGCVTLHAAPAAGQCRDSSDFSEFSALARERVVSIATGTDSTAAYFRSITELVPVATAAEVAYVSDSLVCRAAADAMGARDIPPKDHTAFPDGIWVLAAGPTRYVVFDGTQYAAGSYWLMVFDQNFNILGAIRM